MVKYLSFHHSSFPLKILFNLNGQGHSVPHPLLLCFTLLVVHDAEELKLSVLSTLQKQTNKQHQQGFAWICQA